MGEREGPIDAVVLRQLARINVETCAALGLQRPEEVMLALVGAAGVVLGQAEPMHPDRIEEVERTLERYYQRGQSIGACDRRGAPIVAVVPSEGGRDGA